MTAFKNLTHGIALVVWAIPGVLLTFGALFGGGALIHNLAVAGTYWLWFGGIVALTTWLVTQFKVGWASLAVHAATFLFLSALPHAVPYAWLRLGLDLV